MTTEAKLMRMEMELKQTAKRYLRALYISLALETFFFLFSLGTLVLYLAFMFNKVVIVPWFLNMALSGVLGIAWGSKLFEVRRCISQLKEGKQLISQAQDELDQVREKYISSASKYETN